MRPQAYPKMTLQYDKGVSTLVKISAEATNCHFVCSSDEQKSHKLSKLLDHNLKWDATAECFQGLVCLPHSP